MKKTLTKLIIQIQPKATSTKRSSKTINKYINKVPVNKDELNNQSSADKFIQEQMSQYPMTKRNIISKRQQLLSQKIRHQLNKNRKVFNELVSKLEQKLSFFELQEIREVIQKMSENQLNQNKTTLRKLKSTVNYFLESSTEKINNQDHIIQSANALLEQIRQAQKKKVNQIY